MRPDDRFALTLVAAALVAIVVISTVGLIMGKERQCPESADPASTWDIPSPLEHVPLDASFADMTPAQKLQAAIDAKRARTHNEHGGYIPACGDLPGLVGDDC